MHALYLASSDQVLLSYNNDVKLVSRERGGRGELFAEPLSTHFGGQVRDALDEVAIFVTQSDLECLMSLLDWSSLESPQLVSLLLERIEASYDGASFTAPCFEAMLALRAMIRTAIQQAKYIEDRSRTLEASELTRREETREVSDQEAKKSLNFIDANKVLGVLVELEDQVHQLTHQSEALSPAARRVICQKELSRPHTAIGRLGSLLSLPSDNEVSAVTLAEHGVCSIQDRNLTSGLRFYQHLQVEMENVYRTSPGTGRRDIQAALEDQFKHNLMLRGFSSWNVPLHRSLNSMPPR